MRSALVLMYACLGRVAGLTARAAVRRRPHVLRAVATDADMDKALQAKSPFLREFASRGYLAQCTDIEGLDEKLTEGRVSAYLGFDATADSLHVGSLLQIMILACSRSTATGPSCSLVEVPQSGSIWKR